MLEYQTPQKVQGRLHILKSFASAVGPYFKKVFLWVNFFFLLSWDWEQRALFACFVHVEIADPAERVTG